MCAVTGVILALVLKSTGSSMGTFVSVVLCVGTAMLVFNGLISVYTRINMFTAGINQEYIKLIVKVIGISYVTEISLGMKEENIRLRDHSPEELVFYSKATTDIEYAFPFGWGELWGIADRTDYDLSNHARQSNQDFTYLDPETNEKYIPYCIEPSLGADRVALAFLCNAYDEEEITEGDTRVVLHLHPALAPYKVAVLPLSKKLSDKAQEVYEQLSKKFMCEYDEAGSIGKRYRREDEIGTPYCVTVDFDTLNDNSVTIRDRDTMEQVRVNIDELEKWISEKVEF